MSTSFKSPKNKFRASLTYGKALKDLGSASSFTCNEIGENEMLKHHIEQAIRNKTTLSVVWYENKAIFPEFDWVEVKKEIFNDNKSKREAVAAILTRARQAKGLSQEELGDLVGFARNTIARIEGSRFSPNADQLYALCEALDITITLDGEEI